MEVSTFNKLQIKKFPKKLIADTPENRYWNKYKNIYEKSYPSAISNVAGGNTKNYIAFSYGSTVELFHCKNDTLKNTLNKFKNEVTSLVLRNDGGLMATGENEGKVKIFEVKKKNMLRTYHNHQKAVHASVFSVFDGNLITGSDDMSVKIFSIPTNSIIRTYQNFHNDYIRGISVIKNTANNYISSSYDFNIHLFDILSDKNEPELKFNHGCPVEAIDSSPNGFLLASVGGTYTKIWDIRNSNTPLSSMNLNKKTVTSVKFLQNGERLITGSLDQQLKIFELENFKVSHQFKYDDGILNFDLNPSGSHIAVGLTSGSMIIKKMVIGGVQIEEDEEEKEPMPSFLMNDPNLKRRFKNYQYFYRGIFQKSQDYDIMYKEKKIKKLSNLDKYLKKFEYKNALLAAFKSKKSEVIYSLIEELIQRGVLKLALKKWDEEELKLILEFAANKINSSKFQQIIIEIINIIIDLYGSKLGIITQFFEEFGEILENEINNENEMLQLLGALETIRNCNNHI